VSEIFTVRLSVLMLIAGMALVTYLPRMLPLVVLSRFHLPPALLNWLGFVPVAVLSALLAPSILVSSTGTLALPPAHWELLAAMPALAVSLWTRSLTATVLTGIAAIALLRLIG